MVVIEQLLCFRLSNRLGGRNNQWLFDGVFCWASVAVSMLLEEISLWLYVSINIWQQVSFPESVVAHSDWQDSFQAIFDWRTTCKTCWIECTALDFPDWKFGATSPFTNTLGHHRLICVQVLQTHACRMLILFLQLARADERWEVSIKMTGKGDGTVFS